MNLIALETKIAYEYKKRKNMKRLKEQVEIHGRPDLVSVQYADSVD